MQRTARALALAAMSAAGLGLLALPAYAHVTVSPASATKGGYATLTFKVPTERDEASTTVLEVNFPVDNPLTGASVQPKPGWGYEITKVPLATPITREGGEQITDRVEKIVWTAQNEDAWIGPGEFDVFPISAGPLPSGTDTLVFKAIQTYSNGEVVRWIEEAAPGSTAEVKYPAPKITLAEPAPEPTPGATSPPAGGDVQSAIDAARAAAEAADKAVQDMNASMTAMPVSASSDAPTKNQVNTAIGLGIGGVVVGLVGIGIGAAAMARRPAAAPAPAAPSGPPNPPPPPAV